MEHLKKKKKYLKKTKHCLKVKIKAFQKSIGDGNKLSRSLVLAKEAYLVMSIYDFIKYSRRFHQDFS